MILSQNFGETKTNLSVLSLLCLALHFITICEHKPSQWITCPSGEFINIVYAMYGRLLNNNGICSTNTYPKVDCTAGMSSKIVSDKCNGKEKCEVKATNSWFGDPCERIVKYLDIKYECLSSKCELIYETFPANK